jgi:hypothetical protein
MVGDKFHQNFLPVFTHSILSKCFLSASILRA